MEKEKLANSKNKRVDLQPQFENWFILALIINNMKILR